MKTLNQHTIFLDPRLFHPKSIFNLWTIKKYRLLHDYAYEIIFRRRGVTQPDIAAMVRGSIFYGIKPDVLTKVQKILNQA